MFEDDDDTDIFGSIDWGRIATEAITNGMIIAGGNTEISGFDELGQAAYILGARKRDAFDFEALQLEQRAGQVIAAKQRQSWEERRKGRYAQSRLIAIVAAGGGSAADVVDIDARISTEAAYRAQLAAYEGADAARTMRLQAIGRRYEGSLAMEEGANRQAAYGVMKTAARTEQVSTIASRYAPEISKGVSGLIDAIFDDDGDSPPVYGSEIDAMSQGTDLGFFNWSS